MSKKTLFLTCLFAFLSVTIYAEEKTDKAEGKPVESVEPILFESSGVVSVGGKNIQYTATAGTLIMKNEKDEPIAGFGYTAYVQKGTNKTNRPIMFAYNGAPGSAADQAY